MIPELLPLWKRFDETQAALVDCLEQLPGDRFLWKPAPAANSAAAIIAHIARGDIRYAREIRAALGGPPAQSADITEEAAKERGAALATAQKGAEYALRVAESLTAADLQTVAADDWNPLGPPVVGPLTVAWFLEQMIRHKAYHLGQLWYIATLLEEPPADR